MELRGMAAGVALGVFALAAAAPARADGEGVSWVRPEPRRPAPAPAGLLALLPPGARADDAAVRRVSLGPSADVVERLEQVTDGRGMPAELEVAYTVVPQLEEEIRADLTRGGVERAQLLMMDARNGELLAYVATDPEGFPAARAYPTASLMKVVTAAAVLQHAPRAAARDCRYLGDPNTVIHASDLEPPAHGGRRESFVHAIAISNNPCFARLALHAVGRDALLGEMRRVGLLDPPAAGHPAGRVDPIRDDLELGYLGSGLAGSFITPLTALRLAATLADGHVMQPWWIVRARDAEGHRLALPEREEPRGVWPEEVVSELRNAMVGVTERGTAARGFRDAQGRPLLGVVRVAGKTGTLHGEDPAGVYRWFIGAAPAEAPRIAVAAVAVDSPVPATRIAADALRAVFCRKGTCSAGAAQELLARVAERDAALAAEDAPGEPAPVYALRDLDQPPRPVGVAGLDFPPRLRRHAVSGTVAVLLHLDPQGRVVDAWVDASDLPAFDDFVLEAVRTWRFTPPTHAGRPVAARARLPIPIRIQ